MITPKYVREIPQRYRLEAAKCVSCGNISFPPRLVCPKCKGREFETIKLSDEGKILTYTIIRVAPDNFSHQSPYGVAVVETKEGAKLMAMIADTKIEDIAIGKNVKIVFRKIQDEGVSGIHCYGYKAVVV